MKNIQPEIFFPVSLLLSRKPCLIVGGGKVAERKLKKLLASGAKVTVVCPEPSQYIQEKADNCMINLFKREYIKNDSKGFFLVFTATDSSEVNKQIIKECNKKGILCCAVDRNWRKGSFVTPASFTKGNFTVSISSNGEKCRESKELKNKIKLFLNGKNDQT